MTEHKDFFEEHHPNKKNKNNVKMPEVLYCIQSLLLFKAVMDGAAVCCRIKRDILPVVLSLCQDVDYEVRACMSRLLDPVARGLGSVSHFLFVSQSTMYIIFALTYSFGALVTGPCCNDKKFLSWGVGLTWS